MGRASRLKVLEKRLISSEHYTQWQALARQHDALSGRDQWRHIEYSGDYDYAQIRLRLERLQQLRHAEDYSALLFTLNEGVHGNIGGIGSATLYRYAKLGTKRLIESYIAEVDTSLRVLANVSPAIISAEKKRDFFKRASICFGHTALMLSGGGVLGYQHIGVAKVLTEQGILPTVISGSSAGSIFAGFLGAHSDQEITQRLQCDNFRADIDLKASATGRLTVDDVASLVAHWVPDITFQQAYEKTGRKISVSIAPADRHQRSRLLNAITSPNVSLRSGIMASCAVPGVFPPVMLMAQNAEGGMQAYLPTQRWVDGSFAEDLPAKRLSRLYGTNHSIVSMVNPIVTPFIRADGNSASALSRLAGDFGLALSREVLNLYRGIAQKGGDKWTGLNAILNGIHSIVDQNYTGDINIVPSFKRLRLHKILSHLTEQELQGLIQCGEQSVYPHVENIRLCTQISRTLEAILVQLERPSEAVKLQA